MHMGANLLALSLVVLSVIDRNDGVRRQVVRKVAETTVVEGNRQKFLDCFRCAALFRNVDTVGHVSGGWVCGSAVSL